MRNAYWQKQTQFFKKNVSAKYLKPKKSGRIIIISCSNFNFGPILKYEIQESFSKVVCFLYCDLTYNNKGFADDYVIIRAAKLLLEKLGQSTLAKNNSWVDTCYNQKKPIELLI